jgi:hypothetical protein
MIKTKQEMLNVLRQTSVSNSQIAFLHRSKPLIPRRGLDS